VIAAELELFAVSERMRGTLAQAFDYAKARHHSKVRLEHLLLALTENADAIAALRGSDVEIAGLTSDVSAFLNRIDDAPGPNASQIKILPRSFRYSIWPR
jgi:neural Wiskott-Aldrich syndrome protein